MKTLKEFRASTGALIGAGVATVAGVGAYRKHKNSQERMKHINAGIDKEIALMDKELAQDRKSNKIKEAYSSQDYFARKMANKNNKRVHIKYVDGQPVYTYSNKRGRPRKGWKT